MTHWATKSRKCPRCSGTGDHIVMTGPFSPILYPGECPDCEGTGKQHKEWVAGGG